jgi:hypothetical protein
MGFPAQGKQGQEVSIDHGTSILVGSRLLAFVDNHGIELFAVDSEGAPGSIRPPQHSHDTIKAFVFGSVALEALYVGSR